MVGAGRTAATDETVCGFELFSNLRGGVRAVLLAAAASRSWSKGTTIFQRDDAGDFLVAIKSGRIRLSISTPEGRELVLRHVGPGEVVGELALIDGRPRTADATAVEKTEGWVLHRGDFLLAVEKEPHLGFVLAQHLCGLLRSTNHQMESIALYDLRMRAVRFFLFTLREVFGEKIPAKAVLHLLLNQSELAAILGATRPKLNQVLQGLVAERAIRRDGDLILCDRGRLLQMVAEHEAQA